MTRSARFFLLLCLSCLLCRPATAQAIKPLAPVPVAVQLLPGDVVRERLIGLDSASYQAGRRALALVPAGDAVQADLRHQAALANQQVAALDTELRRCQAARTTAEADADRMRAAARVALASPPRPPWLLDGRTYRAGGAGVVVGLLLSVFIFHN